MWVLGIPNLPCPHSTQIPPNSHTTLIPSHCPHSKSCEAVAKWDAASAYFCAVVIRALLNARVGSDWIDVAEAVAVQ